MRMKAVLRLPADQCDASTVPRFRFDLEFIYKTLGTAKAETKALTCRKPICHRLSQVRDARPLIDKRQSDPLSYARTHDLESSIATAAIVKRVSRDLTCRSNELCLVDE